MGRRAALIVLGVGALLLAPGAPGVPDVPGDPTPPVVTPVVSGTLGSGGWYTSNVTVNWSVVDPESIILSTNGCNTVTLTANTTGTQLTCTAESDGGVTTVSKTFKIDKTAPSATATPSRAADANGWYNHALSVGFAGTDETSGLESCSPTATYAGPDTAATTVSGTCKDKAGNTAPASVPLKYDATAPAATGTARPPDANGWHNHAVTVTFQGSDGTSGVESCTQVTYAGPDDPSVALTGTCFDRAGNQSSSSVFTLKYDETDPVATATAARVPDQNGWYNHSLTVSFAATDAMSGLESCDVPKSYAGPDSPGTSVSGACRDRAGNVATPSVALKYDATAPAVTATPGRAANGNGWYNAPLTVSFAGTDGTSGIAACAAAKSYSGPDDAAAAVAGSCTDNAGNSGSASFGLKYDATAPQATATPGRAADANGWYNHSLAVSFSGTDATSGIDSCDAAKTYAGPDTASASVSGSCRDRAGNSTASSLGLKYDATAPQATASPSRQSNGNGWYSAPLTVSFTGGDATSGLDSCDPTKSYGGPDNGAASVTGTCRDRAGNVGTAAFPLKYDATAPLTSATPSRQANANGWYNAPLTVSFGGTDATAGVDSCDPAKTYSGPDAASTTLSGSCRDKAGNSSAASLAVKYDATAPQATATPSRQPNGNGWYNAPLTIDFAATDGTSGVDSCPAQKSYAGPDNAAATVSGSCFDRAGNGAVAALDLKYDATAPTATATPSRQPNANGWYNAALSVAFTATDATSTVESCDATKSYTGPDTASATVTGACRDKAGNAAAASVALKYDATAPVTTATPARQPNGNGWYNAPLAVSFAATDATSTVDSCDAAKTYAGPDSSSTSVTGACKDRAGNLGAASYGLKYDATAPAATATPSRQPNGNGWYNAPLSVSFTATDATSTVDSCDTAKTYNGPDTASATVTGSCTDEAGNAAAASLALKYDATAPVTTAAPARQPNANGWYSAPLSVSFAATDATSTVDSCDTAKTYSGPDAAAASVSGTCRDKAGNAGTGSLALKYDATGPQATATPSRQPNANGWYNAPLSVAFSATDATSGLQSCPQSQTYAGPDTATGVVSGTCLDKAGNGALASLAVRYDTVAPVAIASTRPPDRGDWFNHPLTISFGGSDATSGVDVCTAPQGYAGPDTASTSVTGSCRDRAGNAGEGTSFGFKYDATAPGVTGAVAARSPDRADWYNHPVAFAVQGADATSGLDSCPVATYAGPDSADASIAAACVDNAGNRATRGFPLRYDATGPAATARADRAPDANGWYNRALTVSFAGVDAVSGLESCAGPEAYNGPDSALALVGGTCLDRAGNVGVASLAVSYDATAPAVTGVEPSRPPDGNGWYNRPVTVRFQGRDATSNIDSCTEASYGGPDAAAASVPGSCRDRAGNMSSPAAFALRYDATAPTIGGLTAKAGNAEVGLSWTTSADTVRVELRRAGVVVYRGSDKSYRDRGLKNGVRYRYELSAYDEAGNAATSGTGARPTAPLYAPTAGAVVTAPPRLAWAAVKGATYYNVQVWRRGRILSAWPKANSFRMRRTWTYAGRRYHLTRGRYHWYVWPGYGRRAEKRFGRQLGSSSFVVR